jgi:GT2 family glycosyltransferase
MKVSILIPCYNARQWVAQAIQSALDQTWADKEVIVVDDGSTDGSLDVIRSFGCAIRYETGPNRGGNVARNRLLELASGEWLQYLDADDYLLPHKIEKQLAELAKPDEVDVAYSPVTMEYWCENGPARREILPIPEPGDPWILLIRWFLPQTGAALWRRQAIIDVGGWKVDQPCCQEHELYLRLLKGDCRFDYCPTAGAVYRQWSTGTVCRRNPIQSFEKRAEIVDQAELHLTAGGQLTPIRRNAVAFTRYECARSMYAIDVNAARRLATKARACHPGYRLPAAVCFPRGYRIAHNVLGFRGAEMLAWTARVTRSITSFGGARGRQTAMAR